ncbi:hypothetical protein CMI37_33135 [Candidatus Pacearchaeota archaeon]|nr:hypothetical protein [Candidatus Pacearchaeota archaeon]|tara:strand:+ start:521 stop:1285 length:765 start_codon:yes stop_codon:yes gene_type:complete
MIADLEKRPGRKDYKKNVLTKEEEVAYFKAVERGIVYEGVMTSNGKVSKRIVSQTEEAREARWELIERNRGLVFKAVRDSYGGQIPDFKDPDFKDLVGEGILALIESVDGFDYKRGFRLSTYAFGSIVKRIKRALRKRREQVGGSLEDFSLGEDDQEGFVSTLPDLNVQQPGERLEREGLADSLLNLVSRLKGDRGAMLIQRHCVGDTLEKMSQDYGVSKQAISKALVRAKKKAREEAEDCGGDLLLEGVEGAR